MVTVVLQPLYSPDLTPANFFIPQAQIPPQETKIWHNCGNKMQIAGGTTENSEKRIFFILPIVEAPLGEVCARQGP